MTTPSPLRTAQEAYHRAPRPQTAGGADRPGAARGERGDPAPLEYIAYGPPQAELDGCPEVLATFGDLESEYAALRRGAGLLDAPHRGTLLVTGAERHDFLDRMLTQKLTGVGPGWAGRSFWLNRKGRIEADLLLAESGERIVAALDFHCAARTAASLDEYLFTEEVEVTDASTSLHHLALHGPAAAAALASAAGLESFALDAGEMRPVTVAGIETIVIRNDQTGECGLEIIVPRDDTGPVWQAIVAADEAVGGSRHRVRPIGWHAFNIARIEAGTPLHLIDFGPDNLPHETGVLKDRVSFAKGCYLGQEIVARTENLGRPRQMLVGLRPGKDALPVAGAEVYAPPDQPPEAAGARVGTVTSSTLSPMLGRQPIAFAMVKSDWTAPGSRVVVSADGDLLEATVGPLRLVPSAEERI
jgi:folate-binding protein YgfZ